MIQGTGNKMWINIEVEEPTLYREVIVYVCQGHYKFFVCAHLEINNANPEYKRKYWKQFGNYCLTEDKTIPFHHVKYWHYLPNQEQLSC